jgi:hypothetical protein
MWINNSVITAQARGDRSLATILSIMKLIFGDGVEYPQIWANEVIIGPHIQPAGYFSNPAKLKNQP